jgi:hypothetical protein
VLLERGGVLGEGVQTVVVVGDRVTTVAGPDLVGYVPEELGSPDGR